MRAAQLGEIPLTGNSHAFLGQRLPTIDVESEAELDQLTAPALGDQVAIPGRTRDKQLLQDVFGAL